MSYGTTDPRTDTERLLGILKSHGVTNDLTPYGPFVLVWGSDWDYETIGIDNVWEWLKSQGK